MEASDISVVHFSPGRIRLRIPKLRGDESAAEALSRKLARIATVMHVHINTATASVLVLYDPEAPKASSALSSIAKTVGLPSDGLADHEVEKRLETAARGATQSGPSPMSNLVKSFASILNRGVGKCTLGTMDLRFLVPAFLVGMGVHSALRSRPLPLPAWYNYFWFAFGIFRAYNQRDEKQD